MTTGTMAALSGTFRLGGCRGGAGTRTSWGVVGAATRGGRENASRPSARTMSATGPAGATGSMDSWVDPTSSTWPGRSSVGLTQRRAVDERAVGGPGIGGHHGLRTHAQVQVTPAGPLVVDGDVGVRVSTDDVAATRPQRVAPAGVRASDHAQVEDRRRGRRRRRPARSASDRAGSARSGRRGPARGRSTGRSGAMRAPVLATQPSTAPVLTTSRSAARSSAPGLAGSVSTRTSTGGRPQHATTSSSSTAGLLGQAVSVTAGSRTSWGPGG